MAHARAVKAIEPSAATGGVAEPVRSWLGEVSSAMT